MKVLVTGAAGYIGDAVIQNLTQKNHDVVALDNMLYTNSYMRPGVNFYRMDVRHSDDLRWLARAHKDIDCVIHLAAIVGDGACAAHPEATVAINEDATREIAKLWPSARFIMASTCSVYGKNNELLDEESITNPLSLYAGTKLASEKYVKEREDYVIFRLGTVYGISTPFARIRNDLVGNVLAFKAWEKSPLKVFGGEQWRPLIHVVDVARIVADSIEMSFKGTYILSEKNYKIIEIAETISSVMSCDIQKTESKFEDLRNYKVDNNKLSSEGLVADISLLGGIKNTFDILGRGVIKDVWLDDYHNERFLRGIS